MKRLFLITALMLLAVALFAQPAASKTIGTLKTLDGTEVRIDANSMGSFLLYVKDDFSFVSKDAVERFTKTLDVISQGMKDITALNLDISENRYVTTISSANSRDMSSSQITFTYRINTVQKGVVVSIRFAYRPLELVLDQAGLDALRDFISKGNAQISTYSDQYGKLEQIIARIRGTLG